MKNKKYERVPKTPEVLNDKGRYYWMTYCRYFLDRNYLTESLLPDIETLAFLQQKRVDLQNDVKYESDEELMGMLNKVNRQIRMLRKNLKIYPRSSEFESTEKTKKQKKKEKKEKKQEKKMELLDNAKNF